MSAADWLTIVGITLSGAATTFAAIELRLLLADRRSARKAEVDGVAVAWHPTIRPNHGDSRGRGTWVYEIVVQNPGPLPLRAVSVTLRFATDVSRHHNDGTEDPPTTSLTMAEPVVLGKSSRRWERTLILPFDQRDRLEDTTASVTFTRADGRRQTNFMDGRPPEVA